MSVHYTLCFFKNNEFVAIEKDALSEVNINEDDVILRYQSSLPDVFGIPDTTQGEFSPANEGEYFVDCLLRLSDCSVSTDPYGNLSFRNAVQKFLLSWAKLRRSTLHPVILVWS